jgi:hypothetical protein
MDFILEYFFVPSLRPRVPACPEQAKRAEAAAALAQLKSEAFF